jgi:hypothetical protein
MGGTGLIGYKGQLKKTHLLISFSGSLQMRSEIITIPQKVIIGNQSFQRSPNNVYIQWPRFDAKFGKVYKGLVAMIECRHFCCPCCNIFAKSHLISYAHDMTVLADVKMKHMVINLAAKCVHDTHKARAARLRNTIIQDDSSLSIWSKLAKNQNYYIGIDMMLYLK